MDKIEGTGEQTMNKYKKEMYKQAEHFGLENRMLQCTEECGELIQALSKYQRVSKGDKTCNLSNYQSLNMVLEEIADVEILLTQLKYLLCKTEEVENIKVKKIERTEQRLGE